jgi:prephenate dehydrogenase
VTDAVFVLGAGRAGRGLSRALRASGIDVIGLHGRRVELEPDVVTAGPLPGTLAGASVVIVAVRDGQLDEALGELAGAPLAAGAVVLHASGSAEPRGLTALRASGHPCGTFHPLVPLADP